MTVTSIRVPRAGRPWVGVAGRRSDWRDGFASGPVAGGGLLLASCTSIQIGAAVARGTFPTIGPLGAAGWRFALAAVLMLGVTRPRVRAWPRRRWRMVLAFGAIAGANEVCLYEALARLPLGMAVTLEFLGPVAVAVLAGRGRRRLACAILALAGVTMICLTKVAVDGLGIAFALAAAAGWGAYIMASERIGRDARPQDSLAMSLAVAAVLTLPLTAAHAASVTTHPSIVMALVIVAALGTASPYLLEMAALRRLAPSAAGVLFSIEPAIAALVGLVGLNQGLGLTQWFGIVIVVAAGAGTLRESPA